MTGQTAHIAEVPQATSSSPNASGASPSAANERPKMPFNFTCPYCFKKTLVAEELVGQSGPCAGCGKQVTIPRPPTDFPAHVHPVGEPRPSEISPQRAERLKRMATAAKLAGFLLFSVVMIGFVLFLLWPSLVGLKLRRDKIACMNNLQLIVNALNEYAAEYGSYPPPVTFDATGAPMHSWRVLILPQLGHLDLYTSYNMEEPWDSLHNASLLPRCPSVYLTPGSNGVVSEGNYFLVTGQGTVFPPTGPLGPSAIGDGVENTLLVVESDNPIFEWTNPIDIDVQKLNPTIGAAGQNTIGGSHSGGATMCFADGTPGWLPNDLDPILLDSIISPAGGEPVDPVDFELR